MSEPEPTLAELLAAYATHRPAESASLRSILKTIALPFLGFRDADLDVAFAATSALKLYALLTPGRAAWCPKLEATLPAGMTYRRTYPRFVSRLVTYGEARGILHPDRYFISPAWRELIATVAVVTQDAAGPKRSALRVAFKKLAKWATAQGIEPSALPVEGDRPVASFFEFLGRRPGDYYRARGCWNALVTSGVLSSDLHWGAIPRGGRAGRARHEWPPVLERALEKLFVEVRLHSWRATTRAGYRQRIATYLGVLAGLGVDPDAVLAGIDDPIAAVRLLVQGLPAGTPRCDVKAFASRLAGDVAFRDDLLLAMAALSGSFDGRASEPNPFVMAAVSALVEAGTITTAADLVSKALSINRILLDLTERHTAWLSQRRALLGKIASKNPSAYTNKKRGVFRNPDLWLDLVRARPRLRGHTLELEAAWRESAGARRARLKLSWAVALRNEALFGLLLCYPLRAANVTGMKVGVNYKPDRYQLFFEAPETKNQKEIDLELPDGGALGDVRNLMDQYLQEARPVLLAGRNSEHVFVPDPRGGTRLREKGLNAIFTDLSRRYLGDVLPPGIDEMNPHLARHVAASYALAVQQNLNLAAQLLNDSPSTIASNYADVLAGAKQATRRFLTSVTL